MLADAGSFDDPAAGRSASPVAVVVLAQVARRARVWGLARFVVGRFGLRRQPGLRFFKVLGSGHRWGFGLRPSLSHFGLFLVFDDDAAARRFIAESAVMRAWAGHADELFSVRLQPYTSRGAWAGRALPASAAPPASGPVAALTRASIKPLRVSAFWRWAPASEQSLRAAPGCRLAVGLGEAPVLRQATFSLWDDAAAIDAYARSGAHRAAAQAACVDGYFSESMFVRFAVRGASGVWQGQRFG